MTRPTIQKVIQRRVLKGLVEGGLSIRGLRDMPVTVIVTVTLHRSGLTVRRN